MLADQICEKVRYKLMKTWGGWPLLCGEKCEARVGVFGKWFREIVQKRRPTLKGLSVFIIMRNKTVSF